MFLDALRHHPYWLYCSLVLLIAKTSTGGFSNSSSISNRRMEGVLDEMTTPASRSRGEIGCYSCVSLADHRTNASLKHSLPNRKVSLPEANVSQFERLFREAGMRMPKVVSQCGETGHSARPNFFGAQLRFCQNSAQKPGACVKLKGFYDGSWFVYRECWGAMWLDPRPFQHPLSGKCYAGELVQRFVGSERNVICFCEEDLCNKGPPVGSDPPRALLSLLLPLGLAFGQFVASIVIRPQN